MHAEAGFTLLETLLAISCSLLLYLSLLSGLTADLETTLALNHLMERDENVELAPLILIPLLSQAGNNTRALSTPGLEVYEDWLMIRSDIDGTGGFPDGRLDAPFESVSLFVKDNQLYLRSGSGSSQPLLRQVKEASWDSGNQALLSVEVESLSEDNGPFPVSFRRLHFSSLLWNHIPNLCPF